MRKLLFLFVVLAFPYPTLSAQCTSSSRAGVHVVQYGETLYRVSKLYNASIDDLRSWNGMKFNQLLSVCQELLIAPPNTRTVATSYAPPVREVLTERSPVTRPATSYQRQAGGKHIIRQGETIATIARLYGYTEQRFREFNVLHAGQEPTPGSVMLTTDCACNRVSYAEHANGMFNGQWNQELIPQSQNGYYHKDYNDNGSTASSYVNEYYTPPNSNATTSYPSNNNSGSATAWGRVPHTAPPIGTNDQVRNAHRATHTPPNNNNKWRSNSTTSPASDPSRKQNTPVPYNQERNAGSYMTNEEMTMIEEINLVRSNPAGYVPYVQAYIQDIRSGKAFGSSTTAAYELIEELKRTGPLSVLQPVECLYKGAQQHGQEAIRKGSSDHQGLDGSWPWDRTKRACPQMEDGNENLVGGPANVREAVMLLLVDDGISNRGHRKTLLQKDWKYVACYKSGQVGRMPNSWVQMFGK